MKIGIDPDKEPELLHLAKEGLMQAVPPDWTVCYNDKIQATYYVNKRTLARQWEHPLDAIYRKIVEQTRLKSNQIPTKNVYDYSDETPQVDDPGVGSLQSKEITEDNIVTNTKPSIVSFKKAVKDPLLEMKDRKPDRLAPIKTSRFEVTKTNPQISLDMIGAITGGRTNLLDVRMNVDGVHEKKLDETSSCKGFTITGTGSMFLKSNKKSDHYTAKSYFTEPFNSSVKGILRDSSLTDVRKRVDETDGEDKKSVRFNLDEIKLLANYSPEDEDPTNVRKFEQSGEASENSDDDPWDFMEYDNVGEEKHVKEITLVPTTNPPPLKAMKPILSTQYNSDVFLAKSLNVLSGLAQTVDNSKMHEKSKLSIVETIKLSDQSPVRPLYDDTDSESKDSSIQSFLQKPSIESDNLVSQTSNMETVRNGHAKQLESFKNQLENEREKKMEHIRDGIQQHEQDILRSYEEGLVNYDMEKVKYELRKIAEKTMEEEKIKIEQEIAREMKKKREDKMREHNELLKIEEIAHEKSFQQNFMNIKQLYEEKVEIIRREYDTKLEDIKKNLDEEQSYKLEEYRVAVQEEYHSKRQQILNEHKSTVGVLQKNHTEILQELERDLKSEEDILKREHQTHLAHMRDKLALELETERQRMRDNGEDRLYEKIRCEKRLLEDKYRCLKEKYIRLKTDVRITLERRQKRREQQGKQGSLTTTGSATETDRSFSSKPSCGKSDHRSNSLSVTFLTNQAKFSQNTKTTLNSAGEQLNDKITGDCHPTRDRKLGLASKYIKQFQLQHQSDTTSISQSDNTISNNYTRGKYLPSPYSDNGNSDSEAFSRNHENNNIARDRQRKKLFSRMKSASTSRLNSENFKVDRPCTPVENLRRQLQKLEDLEDQFPDNTLDTTYHLRYPFSDVANEHAGASSELEFFKHRIHLERDSVRRAKESLRSQRTNFRARQREIKHRHKIGSTRHTLEQLINEERELTEMEVNLHRTRALLGEKVIRLRHLEQSLQRVCEKQNPMDFLHVENKDETTTLSDLSSHSSSGFSSTDVASENTNRRKDMFQEPLECIQNLEILNAEIREFLDILGNRTANGLPYVPVQMLPSELNWSILAAQQIDHQQTENVPPLLHIPPSVPTLADRLETYRQLAAGRVQNSVGTAILAANTIVSQSPRAVNYTTSLVERTRELRNWLRHAKTEHDILSSINVGGNGDTAPTGQHANL